MVSSSENLSFIVPNGTIHSQRRSVNPCDERDKVYHLYASIVVFESGTSMKLSLRMKAHSPTNKTYDKL